MARVKTDCDVVAVRLLAIAVLKPMLTSGLSAIFLLITPLCSTVLDPKRRSSCVTGASGQGCGADTRGCRFRLPGECAARVRTSPEGARGVSRCRPAWDGDFTN